MNLNLLIYCTVVHLLPDVMARGFPGRGIIPFSTKYPDQIIPDESVCLPRVYCNKNTRQAYSSNSGRQAWTDLIVEVGGVGEELGAAEDEDVNYSGPVDLPEGADVEDVKPQDDDQEFSVAPVVAETDNILIEQCERECPQDRQDYCGDFNKQNYLSKEHTMCKYCGLGEKCPYYLDPAKNDLTGRIIRDLETQELIVQLHNEVRSKIARGACNQPKAGCMGPLVWDDELARVAQKWADQCADVDYKGDLKRKDPHLFHDPHPNRKVDDFSDWRGVGQNVARDISRGSAGRFNATSLVGHWFRQIRLFDPEGVKAFGSGDQCSLGVGYYTQLVWENTTHVGCGWAQFQYRGFPGYFENFLVCNYGPAANIWKDPVYTIAETTCDCPCVDCDQEAGMCPANPRYGSWSSWGEWGRCTRSCGGGERDRKRLCTAPTEDGKAREPCPLCKGEGSETEKCNIRKCPEWTAWTPWSECSVSCGEGDRTRQRVCGDGDEEEGACPGESIEYDSCFPGACPAWTAWTEWSSCSASCGGGKRKRLRECGVERTADCVGEAVEEEDCNTQECPAWTEWSEWTPCTKSCDGGKRTKVRECVQPKYGTSLCDGEREVTESCNEQRCPDWTEWTDWTPCTQSCGGGSKSRQRECVIPTDRAAGQPQCDGDSQETVECNVQDCPIWTEWSDWSECSATCAGGEQSRSRECVLPRGVDGCVGDSSESRECNTNVCPVWTEWTDWTECSASCGGGTRFKVRECILPEVRGVIQCPGPEKLTEACNENACPVLTEWSEWTECSASCGGGTRYKRRECIYARDAVENDCREQLEQKEACNESPCPEFGEWSEWTDCTKTCGGGVRKKVRECVLPRSAVEGCTGEAEVEEACNTDQCPVWTEWSEWTECSATCGGGTQQRNRECVLPESRSYLCNGDASEERACNTDRCPDWTEWTDWSQCSKSCGGGTRTKIRECVLTTRGGGGGLQCNGDSEVTEECNQQECPVWTEWTEWTECTQSCGGGTRTKVRECVVPKSSGLCDGESQVTENCNEQQCPAWTEWTDWTECSVSCGGGNRRRSRECVARTGGLGCVGDGEENEACNVQGCPGWGPWSEWSNCTEPCGGGFRERERECLVDGVRCICQEEKLCSGNFKEGETCNEEACPEWTSWSSWSSCSVTCGQGTQTRNRRCRGLGECEGEDSEERDCKERSCVTWTSWGEWTDCSTTCGRGTRERTRKCGNTVRYLSSCPGDDRELETCDSGPCSSWSAWGDWTDCTATCGQGSRSRTRDCVTEGNSRTGQHLPCPGSRQQTEQCNLPACKGWSSWGSWSTCSRSCGGGTRRRERFCTEINQRLGLLLSPCPGSSQESETCNPTPCTTTQAPSVDCGNIKTPSQFYGFNGKPAENIADCSWDYFGCTKRYGSWPSNKDCCMMRYKQCCMQVMGMAPTTQPTTTAASAGYGPQIDIDLDIDLGILENPIDDIDLGNGTGVHRPGVSPVVAELEDLQGSDSFLLNNEVADFDRDPEVRCAKAGRSSLGLLLPHHTDCARFISCQKRSREGWIANQMSCPLGTGFDTELQTCNYRGFVRRCRSSRKARVFAGFEDVMVPHISNILPPLPARQTVNRMTVVQAKAEAFTAARNSGGSASSLLHTTVFLAIMCLLV